jgi:hypothetical protein
MKEQALCEKFSSKNRRPKLPKLLVTRIEFDKTCCIGRESGKSCQIHHLDGTPSSNEVGNLAFLFLQRRSDAEFKGGLGRQT